MSPLFINYCMLLSFAGVILLVTLSFCCFMGVEALRLSDDVRIWKGFSLFCAALVIKLLT
jgi:hypothetical protein